MDAYFMQLAIEEAKKAQELGEVPVGAVIVKENQVIATAYNLRESSKSAISHAEILAIQKACESLGGWRIFGCTLYVTLEPCPMCMGAILNARLDRVVYGTADPKAGCCGSILNMNEFPFNHKVKITKNILQQECSWLLTSFFKRLRDKNIIF